MTDPVVVKALQERLLRMAQEQEFLDALQTLLALHEGLPVTRAGMHRVCSAFSKMHEVDSDGFQIAHNLMHDLPEKEASPSLVTFAVLGSAWTMNIDHPVWHLVDHDSD